MYPNKYIAFLLYSTALFAGHFAKGQESGCCVRPKLQRETLQLDRSIGLPSEIPEASGLVFWNGTLWTHNDSDDPRIYSLDMHSGKIINEYPLPDCRNNDWEDMSQDKEHFYIGDFGNNAGLRDTLIIIRINKMSVLANSPQNDTIKFTWPETITKGIASKTNFNCEAMSVIGDSIYLFTKESKNGQRCRAFSIPKIPGNYKATFLCKLKKRLMITGASYDENSRQLALCGYNSWLKPAVFVFDDFSETLFKGKARKLKIRRCVRQVEGIAVVDGKIYLVSEAFEYFVRRKGELFVGGF